MAGNIFISPGIKIPTTPLTQSVSIQATEIGGMSYSEWALLIVGSIIAFFFLRWAIRLAFELWMSRSLVYIQVALPRSDSKLDKEHETKKDFKEKIGIMNLVHNSFWKISSTSLKYTILHAIFHHIKISYEIVYKE
jgi:hypothetical protein